VKNEKHCGKIQIHPDKNFLSHASSPTFTMGMKAKKSPLTTKRERKVAAAREREVAAAREREVAAAREREVAAAREREVAIGREIAARRSRDAVLRSIGLDPDSHAFPNKQLESKAAGKNWRRGGGGLLKPDRTELSSGSDLSDDESLDGASSSCATSVLRKRPTKVIDKKAHKRPAKPRAKPRAKPPAKPVKQEQLPAQEVFAGPFVIGLQSRWALHPKL
jgi:hypothetical protein